MHFYLFYNQILIQYNRMYIIITYIIVYNMICIKIQI